MNKYTITITNKSGSHQNYALFSQAPVVSGAVQPKIWTNVFKTANTASHQIAKFSIYKQYYAVCGSSSGSPKEGVQVDVSQSIPVTLGSKKDDGSAVPGTAVAFMVDQGAPAFSDKVLPDSSYPNAFEIDTMADFTVAEAKAGEYLFLSSFSRR
jgi:hypothetical protein